MRTRSGTCLRFGHRVAWSAVLSAPDVFSLCLGEEGTCTRRRLCQSSLWGRGGRFLADRARGEKVTGRYSWQQRFWAALGQVRVAGEPSVGVVASAMRTRVAVLGCMLIGCVEVVSVEWWLEFRGSADLKEAKGARQRHVAPVFFSSSICLEGGVQRCLPAWAGLRSRGRWSCGLDRSKIRVRLRRCYHARYLLGTASRASDRALTSWFPRGRDPSKCGCRRGTQTLRVSAFS